LINVTLFGVLVMPITVLGKLNLVTEASPSACPLHYSYRK
jgi:hypothetical protein